MGSIGIYLRGSRRFVAGTGILSLMPVMSLHLPFRLCFIRRTEEPNRADSSFQLTTAWGFKKHGENATRSSSREVSIRVPVFL